jgi:hypothetical protein
LPSEKDIGAPLLETFTVPEAIGRWLGANLGCKAQRQQPNKKKKRKKKEGLWPGPPSARPFGRIVDIWSSKYKNGITSGGNIAARRKEM